MDHSRGLRVEVYFGETDQVRRRPRYQVLLEYLRSEGAAGATVTRGIAGFGRSSLMHTSAILRLSEDLPLVLTWIDAPERVERLLPRLRELAGSGIVTVEEVGIAGYGERQLEQLRFDLPVRDVMVHPAISVPADASVREAVETLVARQLRALPVTDADGRLVGMVSNGDLVDRAGLEARLELLGVLPPKEQRRILDAVPDRPVAEVMTSDPQTIGTDETLAAATRAMSERRLKRLPVADADGRLIGMIARGDILRAVGESFPRPAVPGDHPGATTVGEVMRTDVPSVRDDATVAHLVDVVASTRLNRAVVVDAENRVLGVLSGADVLSILGESRGGGLVGALMRAGGRPHSDRRAGELLRGPADTVTPEVPLATAAQLAMERSRKVLPVVDGDGRLIGIVDRADLLHASRAALDAMGDAGDDART
jgi:CBS domain-containing protein